MATQQKHGHLPLASIESMRLEHEILAASWVFILWGYPR